MEIAVFVGSSSGSSPEFEKAASELGRALAARGIGIVYGGANVGLMGVLADAALAAGGRVTGVIPAALADVELAHTRLTDLRIVRSMHERKATMAELADAFVVLPGGAGTLEEFFEVWTWQHIGLHAKPVALFDVGDFWTPLLATLDGLVSSGFIRHVDRQSLPVVREPSELVAAIAAWAPLGRKWVNNTNVLESVGWLCVRDGRLLVVRTHGRTHYYVPGGKPEPGEQLRYALAREVLEETGITLSPDSLEPAFVIDDRADGQPDLALRMTCFTSDGTGDPQPGREIAEVEWITLRDARRCAPALRQVLRRLAPRLAP